MRDALVEAICHIERALIAGMDEEYKDSLELILASHRSLARFEAKVYDFYTRLNQPGIKQVNLSNSEVIERECSEILWDLFREEVREKP